jgi:putative addiction module CopG family antidote
MVDPAQKIRQIQSRSNFIMSISLTPELEAYVQLRANAGGFASPDDVVREALRRMIVDEGHEGAVLEGLRSETSPLTRDELDEIRKLPTKENQPRISRISRM